ncbi:MAG: carbon-nitrogen family hydrolase [Aquificota bacterium]|nr:MAG: carbon-nitrogen family hydrolase [Aquificota bacterium]
MKEKVTAALIQMEIRKGEPGLNLAKALTLLEVAHNKRAELVVLPEMWLTDFVLKDPQPHLSWSAKALEHLQTVAKEKDLVIVAGSMMEEEEGKIYNTSYVIAKDGIRAKYRKAYLFEPMGELRVFSPGNKALAVDTHLGKLGVIICYDLRFPELTRPLPFQGVEILCVPAQWPVQRVAHWEILLKARAVENQFFVLGCNRWGKAGPYNFPGHSLILDPLGQILAAAHREGIALATLEKKTMDEYRSQIPSLRDSRLAKSNL